jgi:hypothetical protein
MPKKRVVEEEPEREPVRRRRVPRGGVAGSKRETEPDSRPNVRYRLGKRWSQIICEVGEGMYTWDEFCSELTPEELARGQLMDRNGRFQGRPPAMVPRQFQQSCIREIQRRFNEKVQARLLDATDELIELSRSGFLDGKDRAKVLIYLLERVMGPIPKQVQITSGDEGWQGLLTQGFVRPGDTPTAPPPRSDRYSKRRKTVDPSEDKDD